MRKKVNIECRVQLSESEFAGFKNFQDGVDLFVQFMQSLF